MVSKKTPVLCNSLMCVREAAPHQKVSQELRVIAGQEGAPKKLQNRPGEGSQIHLTVLTSPGRSRIKPGIQVSRSGSGQHEAGFQHIYHIAQARIKGQCLSKNAALERRQGDPTEAFSGSFFHSLT